MTEAKQKAQELFNSYYMCIGIDSEIGYKDAKKCASIAVDELIELAIVHDGFRPPLFESAEAYYREVKTEIEKL